MSDHAPLTDEELAEMELRLATEALHKSVDRKALVGLILGLIANLRAARSEVKRLRAVLHEHLADAGPYMLLHWTDDIRHAEPCDCDLDEETAGEACMANSEWTYAVCVDGGAFAPRLILTLPRRPPEQPDHDGPPLVAVPQPQRRRT